MSYKFVYFYAQKFLIIWKYDYNPSIFKIFKSDIWIFFSLSGCHVSNNYNS
jgi:hypothetical protein